MRQPMARASDSDEALPLEAFALEAGLTEGYVRVNGVRFHYVGAGTSGPLVLLLHGFPEFWYSWRHQLLPLAERFRVVAPDLRGYNLSEKPRAGYDIRTLYGDVAALVAAFDAREAHIVGHDWGGVIAWALAIRQPQVVRRLAIINAPHPGTFARELRHLRQLRRSWYAAFFQLPWLPERAIARHDFAAIRALCAAANRRATIFAPEDIERFVAAMARPGALTAALNYYRQVPRAGPGALGPLRRIDTPTLVLWGERDPALGVELLDGLDEWVSDLRIQRYPHARHWLNQECPEEVTQQLLAFLNG